MRGFYKGVKKMKDYNKDIFLQELKEKAKLLEVGAKLDKEIGYAPYLYLCYRFISSLEENNIYYSLHHIHGGTSVLAYLLGFPKYKEDGFANIMTTYFNDEFDKNMVPTISICVSKENHSRAVDILSSFVSITLTLGNGTSYYFGEDNKYHINIISSPYLDRIEKLEKLTNVSIKDIPMDDEDTLSYMLEEDDKGLYMPHLYGTILGGVKFFYQCFSINKPKSLFDLSIIENITRNVYRNNKELLSSLKEQGTLFTIYSKEQLYYLLTDIYEIDKKEAMYMVQKISKGEELDEYQEDLLSINVVPPFIISEFKNIKYLHYLLFSYLEMKLVYILSYYKKHFIEDFSKVVELPYKDSYVGPFFYINNKIYGYKERMDTFSPLLRYIDASISHFDYFSSLLLDDDYGHYPRGRVIYSNIDRMFYIYIDKSLNKENIKKMIIEEYHLEDRPHIFKYDSHYSFDEL